MSADPEEEGVLLAEFEQVLDIPPLRPSLEEIVTMDVKADLKEISKPLVLSPVTPEQIEKLFIHSPKLLAENILFEFIGDRLFAALNSLPSPTPSIQEYQITFISPMVLMKLFNKKEKQL